MSVTSDSTATATAAAVSETAQQVVKYLSEHNLTDVLNQTVNSIVRDQPEYPFRVLANQLLGFGPPHTVELAEYIPSRKSGCVQLIVGSTDKTRITHLVESLPDGNHPSTESILGISLPLDEGRDVSWDFSVALTRLSGLCVPDTVDVTIVYDMGESFMQCSHETYVLLAPLLPTPVSQWEDIVTACATANIDPLQSVKLLVRESTPEQTSSNVLSICSTPASTDTAVNEFHPTATSLARALRVRDGITGKVFIPEQLSVDPALHAELSCMFSPCYSVYPRESAESYMDYISFRQALSNKSGPVVN